MEFITQVFLKLLGQDASAVSVFASWLIALWSFTKFMFGALLIFSIDLSFRDAGSDRTPSKFSLDFLWRDNKLRLLRTALIGLLFLIAGSTIVGITGINVPTEWGGMLPIFAGMSSDAIALMLKRKFIRDNPDTGIRENTGRRQNDAGNEG